MNMLSNKTDHKEDTSSSSKKPIPSQSLTPPSLIRQPATIKNVLYDLPNTGK